MAELQSSPRIDGGMLDADEFLGFADRLRAVHERLEEAQISTEQRGRFQRKLLGITDGAKSDLARAGDMLRRFEAEIDRHAPR